MPLEKPTRKTRELTHAFQTSDSDYVLVIAEKAGPAIRDTQYQVQIGPASKTKLQSYAATKCVDAMDGTKIYRIANGTHPTHLFFPPLTARKPPHMSYHLEESGPRIVPLFLMNGDDVAQEIIGKRGDVDNLDLDIVTPSRTLSLG